MNQARVKPQLTLDLFGAAEHEFESFYPGCNSQVLQALKFWSAGDGPPVVYVWGGADTGKSHLLQAAVKAANAGGSRAICIPVNEFLRTGVKILDGLHELDVVALDDLGLCGGQREWERGLFTLYNASQAAGRRLLLAARQSPAAIAFDLDDLSSRLKASLVYRLRELEDSDKASALRLAARRRGLDIQAPALEVIMQRERRDMKALAQVLQLLDDASLSQGRRLTAPFVREVLDSRDE